MSEPKRIESPLERPLARSQFSLAHVMIAVTVVGLFLSAGWTSYKAHREASDHRHQLRELEREHQRAISDLNAQNRRTIRALKEKLHRFRREAGYPDASDPTRLSVAFKASDAATDRWSWTFRLHIPAARNLVLCYAFDGIGRDNLPAPLERLPVKLYPADNTTPAEISVSAFIGGLQQQYVMRENSYELWISGHGSRFRPVPLPSHNVLHPSQIGPQIRTETTWPVLLAKDGSDVPYVLLRHRVQGPEPSSGLILWLENESSPAPADTPP